MMWRMKHRVIVTILALCVTLMTPAMTLASSSDDEDKNPVDARLLGYQNGTAALNNASGTALTWLLLCVLGGICIAVLFMNPKRSHLD
jgi:hypothetical protein